MNYHVSTMLRPLLPLLLACTFAQQAIAAAPTVTTNAASSVTDTGAKLNGTVNDNGKSTTVTFEAGGTTSYGTTLTATTGGILSAGSGATAVSVNVTGLSCSTTYHFRAKAVNSDGTTLGADQPFTTTACVPGACGSDNGLTLTTPPTNLCNGGTASSVTSTPTSYTWSCDASIASASCSATREYAVTSSVSAAGNGTISASQNVAYSRTPSFTLTPATGYYTASVTGTCGGTLTGNTFVTSPVTANCTVIANFAAPTTHNAFFVNASSSANKTSVMRLINLTNQSAAMTATAYDEAGNMVGTPNTSLGTIAAQQMLTFTSAQLESALGYTPSSGTAKYHLVFNANLASFEVLNFVKDVASGNLTLAHAQNGNRVTGTSNTSTRNMLFVNPSTNLSRTSVVRLINPTNQTGVVTATAYSENGEIPGTLNAPLGTIAPQQMLTFTSAQLESALGYIPSSPSAKYHASFNANLQTFELINFIKDVATGNVTLGQVQINDRAVATASSSVRNALYVNPSNAANTSLIQLINPDVGSGAVTATAYNEAGAIVGRADTALGTLGAQKILSFTSAQLESAIGYVPSSSSAKYRIVFTAALPSFELVNFITDGASGNLIVGQAQVDNRIAGTATSSTRNALFLNASTSTNKTSLIRLVNPTNQDGTITATAYNESGSTIGTINATIGTIAAQQMLTFTSAQLESMLGFIPSAPTAKYRIVFNANLPTFELINFVVDIATGGLTLGQTQID